MGEEIDYREIEPHTVIQATPAVEGEPLTVVAPVIVVAPPTTDTTGEGNIVGDSNRSYSRSHTDTGGGAHVGRNLHARDMVGRDDIQYGSAGSSVTFNNPDNARLWVALMNQMQSLSDVAVKLDDLPSIVTRLSDKVAVLERLQLAVKIEPTPIPVAVPPLPPHPAMLALVAVVAFGIIVAVIILFLIFRQQLGA